MPKGRRRIVRLKGYDYSQPGAYFVTVCTKGRRSNLGRIIGGRIALSAAGEILQVSWDALPRHFADVTVDAFVVMPNHFHGILMILSRDEVVLGESTRHGGWVTRGNYPEPQIGHDAADEFPAKDTRGGRLAAWLL